MIDKVFEMLGVRPYERFKLSDPNNDLAYYLDRDLNLYFEDENGNSVLSTCDIVDILTGNVHITPISTEEKQIAPDRDCGDNIKRQYHYDARDYLYRE